MSRAALTFAIVALGGCELPRDDDGRYPDYEECVAVQGEAAASAPLTVIWPQLQLRPSEGLILTCPSSECLRWSRSEECWFGIDGTFETDDGRPAGALLLDAPETSVGCPEITGIEASATDGSDFRVALPPGTQEPRPEDAWYLPCNDVVDGGAPQIPLLLSFAADAASGAQGILTIHALAAQVPEDGLRLNVRLDR